MTARPRMLITVPEGPHYRADALAAGALALGMDVTRDRGVRPRPGDVLVTWNLHRGQSSLVEQWHAVGGSVLVMENGYIGADDDGRQLYALARDAHNGAGRWYVGGFERWHSLGIVAASAIDYDRDGYTLVIGQRGIGSAQMRSPSTWHHNVGAPAARGRWPGTPVVIREHPGQHRSARALEDDLAGAARVLIWSSACGVSALVRGIPVWFDAPTWIGRQGAQRLAALHSETIATRPTDPRYALRDIAWAQWRLAEIASGEALGRLLMLT